MGKIIIFDLGRRERRVRFTIPATKAAMIEAMRRMVERLETRERRRKRLMGILRQLRQQLSTDPDMVTADWLDRLVGEEVRAQLAFQTFMEAHFPGYSRRQRDKRGHIRVRK